MSSGNPYQVTAEIVADPAEHSSDAASPRRTVLAWGLVFLLNLPIPVFFGAAMVPSFGGYTGMLVGCVLWFGLGIFLCFSRQIVHVRATTLGGWVVALTQFYPILQMIAGMLASAIVSIFLEVGSNGRGPLNPGSVQASLDLVTATAMTLITGTILILVAWLLGHLMAFLYRIIREAR